MKPVCSINRRHRDLRGSAPFTALTASSTYGPIDRLHLLKTNRLNRALGRRDPNSPERRAGLERETMKETIQWSAIHTATRRFIRESRNVFLVYNCFCSGGRVFAKNIHALCTCARIIRASNVVPTHNASVNQTSARTKTVLLLCSRCIACKHLPCTLKYTYVYITIAITYLPG